METNDDISKVNIDRYSSINANESIDVGQLKRSMFRRLEKSKEKATVPRCGRTKNKFNLINEMRKSDFLSL